MTAGSLGSAADPAQQQQLPIVCHNYGRGSCACALYCGWWFGKYFMNIYITDLKYGASLLSFFVFGNGYGGSQLKNKHVDLCIGRRKCNGRPVAPLYSYSGVQMQPPISNQYRGPADNVHGGDLVQRVSADGARAAVEVEPFSADVYGSRRRTHVFLSCSRPVTDILGS